MRLQLKILPLQLQTRTPPPKLPKLSKPLNYPNYFRDRALGAKTLRFGEGFYAVRFTTLGV